MFKIGLVQINNSFFGQGYFPYSVGLLQAYAQKHLKKPEMFKFLLPIYSRIPISEACEQLKDADIVAFSVYVWNMQISLKIASEVKKNNPSALIVFGGPQAPNEPKDFLLTNSFIDILCHGEGEAVFLDILENYEKYDWNNVQSISFRKNGRIVKNTNVARISDLDKIPSPYLSGAFEPLMRDKPNEQWIVLMETNRGCPFSCAFCDWGSAVQNKVHAFCLERVYEEIDWISKHRIEFVYCCDANFGILPRDLKIVERFAANKKKYGYPKAFSVQNTKNSTEKSYKIQSVLAQAGLNKGVTLSLQTMHKPALKSVNRQNISSSVFQELQQKFAKSGIETYTDVILGLPGETYETFTQGVSKIIESGQHNRIQFNNLSILPNAEMNTREYRSKYGLDIQETKIINIHGSLAESDDGIYETQELAVASDAMPREAWVRTRVFSWMTALLHFDKVLQIPLIIVNKISGISFKCMIEAFMTASGPALSEIRSFFEDKAMDIQRGGVEYCESKDWLNIWWPADELVLIRLCTGGKLKEFYNEAEIVLKMLAKDSVASVIHEAIYLNQSLLKIPFQTEDLCVSFSFHLWKVYQETLRGEPVPIENGEFTYKIDRTSQKWDNWQDWCREVIWYGNKKGAYLYPCQLIS